MRFIPKQKEVNSASPAAAGVLQSPAGGSGSPPSPSGAGSQTVEGDDAVAAEYDAWLEARGISLEESVPEHERAALAAEFIDLEIERRQRELEFAERAGDRARARSRKARIELLEDAACKLFGKLNPPAINGEPYRPGFSLCRFCGTYFDEKLVYEQGNMCGKCWAIGTGKAEPPGPADSLEKEVNDLVS